MKTHPNLINESNLEWVEQSYGEQFGLRRKSLSAATGGSKLGCSLHEVLLGRRAWPYHYHSADEEANYVLGVRARFVWMERRLKFQGYLGEIIS